MKGKNTLTLNQATLIAAVQHYFAAKVYREDVCPRVTAVKQSDKARNGYGSSETFDVEIEEQTSEAAPTA